VRGRKTEKSEGVFGVLKIEKRQPGKEVLIEGGGKEEKAGKSTLTWAIKRLSYSKGKRAASEKEKSSKAIQA